MYLAILLAALATPALSGEALEPVEVVAQKNLKKFYLGKEESVDLSSTPDQLVSSALQNTNGIVPSQSGGPGSRVAYFIRGTEARHVSFTIDGLKLNDPSSNDRQFDAAFLLSPFLKEMTIYKGPQAILFGSDAMGGLVDMRTRKGEESPETRLLLNAGSFGTVGSSISQDWAKGRSRGTLTASTSRTDGLSRLNKKRFKASERDGSNIVQLSSSSTHRWSKHWETDLLFSYLRGQNELDGATDDNAHDKSTNDQYLAQQRTNFELNPNSSISVRNGVSRHQREIRTLVVGQNSFAGNLIQHEGIYHFDNKDMDLLAGASLEQEDLRQDDLVKSADLTSAFVQAAKYAGDLKLHAGLRSQAHSLFGNYHTGSAGVAYADLSLQYSQGLKAPSLYQLNGRPLFGFPIGNRHLEPEKNNAVELNWTRSNTQITVFRNSLSNLITFTNQGYLNQAHFLAQGLELEHEFRGDAFSLRPGITIQEFKEERSRVLRRPTQSLNLIAKWFFGEKIELFGQLRAYNARYDINPDGSTVKLNGFETINLGTKYYFGKSELGFQLQNITNREYEELFGYSVMPRSFFAHLGHKF